MEETQLKIEGSTEDLKALQEYLFEQDPELLVNEIYKHEAGVNKEPIVTSIIIALGGKKILASVQALLQSWFKHSEAVLKEKNRHQEEMFKLSLKAGKSGYTEVSRKNFMEMKAG